MNVEIPIYVGPNQGMIKRHAAVVVENTPLCLSIILKLNKIYTVICSLLGNSRCLSSNCRRFGTHYRFHLHRQVNEVCQWQDCAWYLYLVGLERGSGSDTSPIQPNQV